MFSLGTPRRCGPSRWLYTFIEMSYLSSSNPKLPAIPQQPSSRISAFAPISLKRDRKSTRLNSSHMSISYAVFCLKKKKILKNQRLAASTNTGMLVVAEAQCLPHCTKHQYDVRRNMACNTSFSVCRAAESVEQTDV